MKTIPTLIIGAIFLTATPTRSSADELLVTSNLPKTVVIDFSKPTTTETIVIRLSDGREISISKAGDDRISLIAGTFPESDSAKIQEFIVFPAAANWLYLSTKVSLETHGDLKKRDEEFRKILKENKKE